jgi:hypothetical protein
MAQIWKLVRRIRRAFQSITTRYNFSGALVYRNRIKFIQQKWILAKVETQWLSATMGGIHRLETLLLRTEIFGSLL